MGVFLADQSAAVYERIFGSAGAAAVIPLTSVERVFGVLCLAFNRPRQFSFQDVRLYDTIAEIAGTSLQRAVLLQTLERQVDIRTAHLSTLYEINAVGDEPLVLEIALERVLNILLGALGGWAGVIHLLGDGADELSLSVQHGLPLDRLTALANLSLAQGAWRELLFGAEPLVVPDVHAAEDLAQDLPAALRFSLPGSKPTYLGVPIRAEGRVLGLLSVFGVDVLENAIENLALLMTISDQIGGYIERAGLIRQAERAAVFEERQRLARELHDSVTQLLYSQVLFSGAGSKVLDQGDTSRAEEHLARIHQAALQALKEMRLLIFELRPSADLDGGLAQALEHRLDSVERKMGVDASLQVTGPLEFDYDQQVALYRIAEEALNNTLKHAEASMVEVKLGSEASRFILEVHDDGRGFVPETQDGRGMGLDNMRTRARELGGAFHLTSSPGQGTRIKVIIEPQERTL
jgi:signal transduction histidine kinase